MRGLPLALTKVAWNPITATSRALGFAPKYFPLATGAAGAALGGGMGVGYSSEAWDPTKNTFQNMGTGMLRTMGGMALGGAIGAGAGRLLSSKPMADYFKNLGRANSPAAIGGIAGALTGGAVGLTTGDKDTPWYSSVGRGLAGTAAGGLAGSALAHQFRRGGMVRNMFSGRGGPTPPTPPTPPGGPTTGPQNWYDSFMNTNVGGQTVAQHLADPNFNTNAQRVLGGWATTASGSLGALNRAAGPYALPAAMLGGTYLAGTAINTAGNAIASGANAAGNIVGGGAQAIGNAIGGAPQPYYPQPYYPHY